MHGEETKRYEPLLEQLAILLSVISGHLMSGVGLYSEIRLSYIRGSRVVEIK